MNKKAAAAAPSPVVAKNEPANEGKQAALAVLVQDRKRRPPDHKPSLRKRRQRAIE